MTPPSAKGVNLDITAKQLGYINEIGAEVVTPNPILGIPGRRICEPYYIEYRYGYHPPNRPEIFRMRIDKLVNLADQARVYGYVPILDITWSDGQERLIIPEKHCRKILPPRIRQKLLSSRKIRRIMSAGYLAPSVRRLEDPSGERWVLLSRAELQNWAGITLPPPDLREY